MEAEIIRNFSAKLIIAIQDSVRSVSDQCLAKGLITASTYRNVTESGGSSEDKARTLLQAVLTSIEIDGTCLDTLLDILQETLPYRIKGKLLSEIRTEITEKANPCREVVLATSELQLANLEELSKESVQEHSVLLGKLENAITQHAEACAEKTLLEKRLKAKTKKCDTLKRELESMRSKNEETQDITNTESRIKASTSQIENLKERIQQIEEKVEEQAMYMKRGRNTINTKTRKMFLKLVEQFRQEISRKEEEHSQALRETEASALKKAEDMRVRDREHQLVVQEKELRIRELELGSQQQADSTEQKVIPTDILKPQHLDNLHWSTTGGNLLSVAMRWRDIGSHLGFSDKEMDIIHQQKTDNENQCLYELLDQWLEWYPGDSRGSTSFPTYSRIQKVLVDIGFGNVARDFMTYESITVTSKPSDDEFDIPYDD